MTDLTRTPLTIYRQQDRAAISLRAYLDISRARRKATMMLPPSPQCRMVNRARERERFTNSRNVDAVSPVCFMRGYTRMRIVP